MAPTLVLVGESDNLLAASRAIHGQIAGSRFVMLRNCMHGSNLWRPDAFLRVVLEFLADVDAGRPVAGAVTID
jgi:pimeloyl-ACP methyl ester carboxylesterase